MLKLEFTIDEANQIVSLLDAAVRANGMKAALAAVPIVQRLEAAAAAASPKKEEQQ